MGKHLKLRVLRKSDDDENAEIVTVPLVDNYSAVSASALSRAIFAGESAQLRFLDPGFTNTAVTRSRITYIDGANGVLLYRGYPIEQLAERSTFLEVAYLLQHGELPTAAERSIWVGLVMSHTFVHESLLRFLASFRYDAHPMGMLIAGLAAMSTNHAGANPALRARDLYDADASRGVRNKQVYRILGGAATLAACAYRHRIGRPYNYPDSAGAAGYAENFLAMLDRLAETAHTPHPALARALDVLFIVHADHELNCSTAAVRHLASTRADPFTSVAAAAAALYGPLHGGASEAVVRMLEEIGSVDRIDGFLADVKARRKLLMGFGHRVYRSYDPRARILKRYSQEVFDVVGRDALSEVAEELERRALEDSYFKDRKLYPNVDFYSGLMYRAMGFPLDFYAVLFAIPRCAGWLAHWCEEIDDTDGSEVLAGATHLTRPGQIWTGAAGVSEHETADQRPLLSLSSRASVRRRLAEKG